MALDFKNMRGNVGKLLQAHEDLNKEIIAATEKAADTMAHVKDYGTMYENIKSDVEFAATQLGNGGAVETSSEQQKQSGG